MQIPEISWQRLQSQIDVLNILLLGLDESAMQSHPMSGKWSIHENLAHLGRYQEIFRDRIKKILQEDKPLLTRYQAEEDPLFARWLDRDVTEIRHLLVLNRQEIYDFIRGISPDGFSRLGTHPKFGPLTLTQWIEFFLLHEAHHFYIILSLVGALSQNSDQ
ncbi:MAG: DinB family protein [Bacteroidia bacterium]|nr:DinB family protein [Bacteroidia bacterium]